MLIIDIIFYQLIAVEQCSSVGGGGLFGAEKRCLESSQTLTDVF